VNWLQRELLRRGQEALVVRLNFVFFTDSVSELYGQRMYIFYDTSIFLLFHATRFNIVPLQLDNEPSIHTTVCSICWHPLFGTLQAHAVTGLDSWWHHKISFPSVPNWVSETKKLWGTKSGEYWQYGSTVMHFFGQKFPHKAELKPIHT
jgi:hypothetical protein